MRTKQIEHELDPKLLKTRLASFVLPGSLAAIKGLLLRSLGDDVTLAQLVEINDEALLIKPMLGKTRLGIIRSLQQGLLEGKYHIAPHPDEEASGDCVFDGMDDIPLEELEQVLIDAVKTFINQLDDRSRYIFTSRRGWETVALTLDETGKTLPGDVVLTRERIRQVQEQLDQDFTTVFLRVSSRTIWASIKLNLSLWGVPLFPRLRNFFSQEKAFYGFLEFCCLLDNGRILNMTRPNIDHSILNDYWVENVSPVHYSQLVQYLQSEHGFERAVAKNALIRLKESGNLKINEGKITPLGLTKAVAVAHTASVLSVSAHWREIYEKVNQLGITGTKFQLNRQGSDIATAVKNGWIYQSGPVGQYQTLSQLELSEEGIESILSALKECLADEKRGGRNSVHLAVDFYEGYPQSLGYFIVRHVVRMHGERQGIFFNGKSGADTVSLDAEFPLASQEKAIFQMFVKAGGPLNSRIIAQSIRSKSIGHAGFYIDRLSKAGKVVRISVSDYALPTEAFELVDIPKIVKAATIFLEEESRVVEGTVLQSHLNRELGLDKSKYFYLSLLRMYAGKQAGI